MVPEEHGREPEWLATRATDTSVLPTVPNGTYAVDASAYARRWTDFSITMTSGDVVIHTISAGGGVAYALSGMPGSELARFDSMRAASLHARAYARPTGVDVWAEQASGYVLLVGRFRPAGQRTPSSV